MGIVAEKEVSLLKNTRPPKEALEQVEEVEALEQVGAVSAEPQGGTVLLPLPSPPLSFSFSLFEMETTFLGQETNKDKDTFYMKGYEYITSHTHNIIHT